MGSLETTVLEHLVGDGKDNCVGGGHGVLATTRGEADQDARGEDEKQKGGRQKVLPLHFYE